MDEFWDDNTYPLAYLITIRTYGTWLHGDERRSVDRHGKNVYGRERIAQNKDLHHLMREAMSDDPFTLSARQRAVVESQVRDVCRRREYILSALHVRTNHFHAVVGAEVKPETIATAFKGNATRAMREAGLIGPETKVWSRGSSHRYLWKPENVQRAINYTLYRQGEELFDDWTGIA